MASVGDLFAIVMSSAMCIWRSGKTDCGGWWKERIRKKVKGVKAARGSSDRLGPRFPKAARDIGYKPISVCDDIQGCMAGDRPAIVQ